MPKKRSTPEEIVAKLRQVDVLVSHGKSVTDAKTGFLLREIGAPRIVERCDSGATSPPKRHDVYQGASRLLIPTLIKPHAAAYLHEGA